MLKFVAGLASGLFIVVGLAWLVAPGYVSMQMRMPLLDGDGLSTQIGDLAGFFLTLGSSIALTLVTTRGEFLFPAIMLLGFAAIGRVIAWVAHGAGLPLDMIAVEVVLVVLLTLLARQMASDRA